MYRFTRAGTTTRSRKPSTSGRIFLAVVLALGLLSVGVSKGVLRYIGDHSTLPAVVYSEFYENAQNMADADPLR